MQKIIPILFHNKYEFLNRASNTKIAANLQFVTLLFVIQDDATLPQDAFDRETDKLVCCWLFILISVVS